MLVGFSAIGALWPALSAWLAKVLCKGSRFAFVSAVALSHGAISLATVHTLARNQPFSIDGAVYLFQARALAHGALGVPMEFPRQAFSQRFLFEGADHLLHGVFPPGWPLWLAGFVRLGAPMLAGPVVAVLLVLASESLSRALAEREWPDHSQETLAQRELLVRASILLSLPSFSRAAETADLLSHAFVAALFAAAITLALRVDLVAVSLAKPRTWLRPVALGACVAWAFSSRLLDGLFVALCVALVLLARAPSALRRLSDKREKFSRIAAILLALGMGAAPFVSLTLAHQHAATGRWLTPTQSEYFARSDWPPTCHRLGFGRDVGCEVEHGDERASMAPDGYTPRRAFGVARSRAEVLGEDLVMPGQLLFVAMLLVCVSPSLSASFCAAVVCAFAYVYGLFYYGNAALFGARHLFPVAPFAYYLLARALFIPSLAHRKRLQPAGLVVAVMLSSLIGQSSRWLVIPQVIAGWTGRNYPIREALARHQSPDGIVLSPSVIHAIAAQDPWADQGRRVIVVQDNAGNFELRRAHPDWSLWTVVVSGALVPLPRGPVPLASVIELESAWPSLQWPSGLMAHRARAERFAGAPRLSGSEALALEHARPSSSLQIELDLAQTGQFRVAISYLAAAHHGDYRVTLNAQDLGVLRGYAPALSMGLFVAPTPLALRAGAQRLVFTCVGADARASGHDAALDAFVARPVSQTP